MKRITGILTGRIGQSAVIVFCLVACVSSLQAKMTDWEALAWSKQDAPGKVDLVVKMFIGGRPADAAAALETLLAEGLADREMVAATDKLSPAMRQRWVANAVTAEAAKKLLDRVEAAASNLRDDPNYINSVVGKLTEGGDARWQAARRCVQLNEYAVPALVKLLTQTEDTRLRVFVGNTLVLMGSRAVRPLSEAVRIDDAAAAAAVCDTLGELRSELALGALSEVMADTGAQPMVRKAAARALVRIQATDNRRIPEQTSSAGYYYALADAYLHEAGFTLPTLQGDKLPLWNWSAENRTIERKDVPAKLYNEKMAQKCCYAGLRTDRSNAALRALLLSSLFAQKLELAGQASPETERAFKMAILAGGEQTLYDSLGKALTDGDTGLAILACQALGEVTTGKGLPPDRRGVINNPLLGALVCSSQPLRLAAAQAIVSQAPTRDQGAFENMDRVLPALSWGLLHKTSARRVLVAHPADAVTATYRELLSGMDYRMIEALTTEALLARCAELPKPDVVIMDSSMSDALPQVAAALLNVSVPVIFIGGDDGLTAFGKMPPLKPAPSLDELKAQLEPVLKGDAEEKLVADLLPNVSQRSAETLASIHAEVAPYCMSDVVPALRQALSYESDAIRIPAIKTLGSIGAGEAIPDLLKVAAAAGNSKGVRLAALDGLAAIFEGTGQVGPDVFRRLVPVTDNEDGEIAFGAARAVALAKFDPEQFGDLVMRKRVQAIKAGLNH